MARRRAQLAPIGLTSNGVLLVNVLGLLAPAQLAKVRACLPRGLGKDWFLGVPAGAHDVELVLDRIDDAAAEAIAKTSLGARASKARR